MLDRADIERAWQSIARLGKRRIAVVAIVLAAGTAAILASTFILSRADHEVAYVGLSAVDAARIGRVLSEANLAHEISADGSRLMVRRGEVSRIRAFLAERGLPSVSTSGYELFDKVGPLGLTSFMQEITRVRALEGEIARTVQLLKGIKAARVHIVLGDQASFRRQRQAPSASVVIRTETASDRQQTDAIRHIVAAAVPGLVAPEVRVVSADGKVLSAGGEDGQGSGDRMVVLEKSIAQELQGNISRTLVPQLGLENFEASVSVRVNIDKRQTNETSYSPETKVERSVRITKETGNSQNGAKNGVVSVEQNIPSEQSNSNGADQSRRSNQKRDEVINYEVGSRSTAITSDGYRIERMSVAVVLNAKRLAELVGPAASADVVAKKIAEVERLVASAAGADSKRGDVVTVAAVDFIQSAPAADIVDSESGVVASLRRNTGLLLQIVAILGATIILVFFGMRPATMALIKNSGSGLVSVPANGGAIAAIGAEGGSPIESQLPSGAVLIPPQENQRGDIGQIDEPPVNLIRRLANEDPSRAALVLRRWIKEEVEK